MVKIWKKNVCVNIYNYKNTSSFPLILETPNYMFDMEQLSLRSLVELHPISSQDFAKRKMNESRDDYLGDAKISKEMADLG